MKQKSGLGRRRGCLRVGCQPFKFWKSISEIRISGWSKVFFRFLVENGSFLHHVLLFTLNLKSYYMSSECQKFKHLGKRWCFSPLSFLNLSNSKLKQHEAIIIYF